MNDFKASVDIIVRDPMAQAAHGGSKAKRWRDEQAGDWPRRVKLSPSGSAVGWYQSEILEAQERRKQLAREKVDLRARDHGRFAKAEGSSNA